MNTLELNFMSILLEERTYSFEKDLNLFKMLDKIVQQYENAFTKKYKYVDVHVMGSDNMMVLVSVEGDIKHRMYSTRPNSHLYYTVQKSNGKAITYHSSWITFK